VSCSAGQTGCRSVAQTVTHPPATISGNINCPQTGDNGDCTAAASLSLSGNEPLSGYHITNLEGTRNGDAFLCEGSSCTISLLEGANAFTFWALSDWGDSSEMGSANRAVDTRSPSVSASASGTPGSGSWFVSAVTIEASASDPSPGSGLASFQAAVDGSWGAYSGTITLNDGSHTVELLATDNAGLNDSASMSFQIDTIAPTTVFTDPTGTSWATGTIALSGVSSDLNLAGTEISYNGGSSWTSLSPDSGGNWSTNWNTHTVANGSYSVRARGRDQAGNVGGADSVTIMVDNGEPRIYIPASWPIWQRVAINVVDNGIGVERVRLTIHGGEFGERVYYWSSGPDDFKWDRRFGDIVAPIGSYPVEVEAWDRVGNKGAAWGEIVIPAPDEEEQEEEPGVLSVEPPGEPYEPPSTSGDEEAIPLPTNTPETPKVTVFGESVEETASEELTTLTGSDNLLVGSAAVSAISAVMAYILYTRRKRQEEEEQKAKAAAQFNAQQRALEEHRNKKLAWWRALQRAAELIAIGSSVAAGILAIGSAIDSGIFASKGLMSLTPEPECQYFGGAYQICVTANQQCYLFVDGSQSCVSMPTSEPTPSVKCVHLTGTHEACFTEGAAISKDQNCVDYGAGNTRCFFVPTPIDFDQLSTEEPGNTEYNGSMLYDWYRKLYYDKDGWWWDVYGNDGNFSIWESMSILMIHELHLHWQNMDVEVMIEGSIRTANAWCQTIYKISGPCSDVQFVNWFAAYVDSGEHRVPNGYADDPFSKYYNPKTGESTFTSSDLEWVSSITSAWIDRDPEYDDGFSKFRPYGWGDSRLGHIAWISEFLNDNPDFAFYWLEGFLIPSGCIDKAMKQEGDWTTDNCIPVR